MVLAAAVLAALRPAAIVELPAAASLAAACLTAALHLPDLRTVRLCSIAAAAVANKAGANPPSYLMRAISSLPTNPTERCLLLITAKVMHCHQGGPIGEECVSALVSSVSRAVGAEHTRRSALIALGWLTRGLAMRGHQRTQDCLQMVRQRSALIPFASMSLTMYCSKQRWSVAAVTLPVFAPCLALTHCSMGCVLVPALTT